MSARERLLRDAKRLGGEEHIQCIDCDYGFKIHRFWYFRAILESIPVDTKGLLYTENMFLDFPGDASGKEPTCQRRRRKRHRFLPWVGKIPGGGTGNPLQYSCLENPMDRGAWRATVHGVTKRWTQLKWLSIVSQLWKSAKICHGCML